LVLEFNSSQFIADEIRDIISRRYRRPTHRFRKKEHRRTKWIYTTIYGRDYVLILHEGQNIPRTEKARREKALKIQAETEKKLKVEEIKSSKPVNFPFLKDKENTVLSLKAMGLNYAEIAKTVSGGRRGWKVTKASVRGMLSRIYKKLESEGVEVLKHGRYIEFSRRQ